MTDAIDRRTITIKALREAVAEKKCPICEFGWDAMEECVWFKGYTIHVCSRHEDMMVAVWSSIPHKKV